MGWLNEAFIYFNVLISTVHKDLLIQTFLGLQLVEGDNQLCIA